MLILNFNGFFPAHLAICCVCCCAVMWVYAGWFLLYRINFSSLDIFLVFFLLRLLIFTAIKEGVCLHWISREYVVVVVVVIVVVVIVVGLCHSLTCVISLCLWHTSFPRVPCSSAYIGNSTAVQAWLHLLMLSHLARQHIPLIVEVIKASWLWSRHL